MFLVASWSTFTRESERVIPSSWVAWSPNPFVISLPLKKMPRAVVSLRPLLTLVTRSFSTMIP